MKLAKIFGIRTSTKVNSCHACKIGLSHPNAETSSDSVLNALLSERYELQCNIHDLDFKIHTHMCRSNNLYSMGIIDSCDAEERIVRQLKLKRREYYAAITKKQASINERQRAMKSDSALVSH